MRPMLFKKSWNLSYSNVVGAPVKLPCFAWYIYCFIDYSIFLNVNSSYSLLENPSSFFSFRPIWHLRMLKFQNLKKIHIYIDIYIYIYIYRYIYYIYIYYIYIYIYLYIYIYYIYIYYIYIYIYLYIYMYIYIIINNY